MSQIEVDQHMLVSAVRYALLRQTYIVGWTIDEVIRTWQRLDHGVRLIILRDIEDELGRVPNMMNEYDRTEWRRVIDHSRSLT